MNGMGSGVETLVVGGHRLGLPYCYICGDVSCTTRGTFFVHDFVLMLIRQDEVGGGGCALTLKG